MTYLKGIAVVLVVLFVLVLMVTLVSAESNRTAAPTADRVTITTTAPMSGTVTIPVAVLKGGQFTLTMPSNQTTGYSWRMASKLNSKIVTPAGSKYNAPNTGMPGQGGTETWTFKAVGKGTQTIKMEYARPWEKNTPPAKTQVFSVSVQ